MTARKKGTRDSRSARDMHAFMTADSFGPDRSPSQASAVSPTGSSQIIFSASSYQSVRRGKTSRHGMASRLQLGRTCEGRKGDPFLGEDSLHCSAGILFISSAIGLISAQRTGGPSVRGTASRYLMITWDIGTGDGC